MAAQVALLPPISTLLGSREPIAKSASFAIQDGSPSRRVSGADEALQNDFINESTVWKQIERSLNLPALYRRREDLTVTLRMLHRVSFLRGLSDEDMMTVANNMSITTLSSQGSVIWEKKCVEDLQPVVATVSGSGSDDDLGMPSGEQVQSGAPEPTGSTRSMRPSGVTLDEFSLTTSMPAFTYPTQTIYILARGKVLLQIPTVNGPQYFPILPLDSFANELTTEALPVGSRYITAEPCTLVGLHPGEQPMNRILLQCDRYMLDEQIRGLRCNAKAKLFESWSPEDYEACARCLVPLRLDGHQMVIEEGEASDSMYVLKEGSLIATRITKPHPKKKYAHTKPRASEGYAGMVRHVPDPSLGPNEHIMQVATIAPGELFGELGLLCHDPDVRPGENIVWTDDYWEGALTERFREADSIAAASFVKELRGGEEKSEKEEERGESAEPSSQSSLPPIDIRYPLQTSPRVATVYAQVPSIVYRIVYPDCRRCISGVALTRLMEFIKGYPGHDDIFEQFEKQLKWTMYREEFIADVLQRNHRAGCVKRRELPKMKF